jgi:hypothetical protein
MELLTPELRKLLPPLYAADPVGFIKFFTPDSHWTWYATEGSRGRWRLRALWLRVRV